VPGRAHKKDDSPFRSITSKKMANGLIVITQNTSEFGRAKPKSVGLGSSVIFISRYVDMACMSTGSVAGYMVLLGCQHQ
jgi:hypothetical protein